MILYNMLYNMLYNTIYNMLPLLIGFGRTVSAWLPPIQTIQSQSTNLILQWTWTWAVKACCGMPGPSCSSTAQWLPRAVSATLAGTDSLLWFSSAHSSPSRCQLIPSWSEKECPCSTTVPAALICLAFICALLRTCLVVCQWCRALWLETARPPCHIDLATAMELLPIPAQGGATEVGCTSSTSGCGGMGGASQGMSLWQKLSRGARNERVMLDDRGSCDDEAAQGGAWASQWWQCWWLKGTFCQWCYITCYVTCYIIVRMCYIPLWVWYNIFIRYMTPHAI